MTFYKKLSWNTLIIGLGDTGSKLMRFLLVPFYTFYLTPSEYGEADLFTLSINVLLPIITLSIADSVFRYSIKKSQQKNIYTTACFFLILVSLASILLFPLLYKINITHSSVVLLVTLLIAQSWQTLFQQQVRAMGKLILYAISGLLSSVLLVIVNVYLLKYLNFGINGYLIAMICASIFQTCFLFSIGKLYQLFSIHKFNIFTLKNLIYYSIPLIPNSILWWMMQVSDRYLIAAQIGLASAGIYAVATKIPSLLSMFHSIFFQSWSLSAIENNIGPENSLFSKVFTRYSIILFMVSESILLLVFPFSKLLFAESYQQAWQYIPFLVVAVICSSFASFLEVAYLIKVQTAQLVTTTLIGGVINISLTILTLPIIGILGASVSTFIGFLITMLLRMRHLKFYSKIEFIISFWLSFAMLILQCIYLSLVPYPIWNIQIMFMLIIFFNQIFVFKNLNKDKTDNMEVN